jgi:hypothetical protein
MLRKGGNKPMTRRAGLHRLLMSGGLMAVFLFLVTTGVVRAQQPGQAAPPIKDPKFETLERQNREATLRSAELGAAVEKTDQQRIHATIEQIKEDFRRLQVIRNEMVHNLLAGKPLDNKLISVQVEEINKRAARFRTYLVPTTPAGPEESNKKQVELNSSEMKEALVRLCNLIVSFVENPVLKNPGTNDAQQSTKANSDLVNIINLSDNIKRSADKLNKTPE